LLRHDLALARGGTMSVALVIAHSIALIQPWAVRRGGGA